MTDQQAREIFDICLAKHIADGNQDKVARTEMCREYFTNPKFRAFMEQCIWSINKGR